jgi:hypothetical protein
MNFRSTIVALSACAVMALALPAGAQTARPGDRAVEDMIKEVEKSEQKFVRALDKDIKRATVRSASGEVDMEHFLDDFATSIKRLDERFDAKYSASAELTALMRSAGDLDKFIQSQPASLKGRSEWDEFKASLSSLAAAYGSAFPLDESKPPRRMNDLEIQQAADSAIDHGSDLKRELSDIFSKEEKATRETAESDIEALENASRKLKSRVDDGKPASGEAAVFSEAVKKLQATLGSRTLTEDAKTASDGIASAGAKVDQAFNIAPSAPAAAPATDVPAAPAAAPSESPATPTASGT